jgi:hypothetical protein
LFGSIESHEEVVLVERTVRTLIGSKSTKTRTSSIAGDHEVNDNFSGKGNNIDYFTFVCWLEWKMILTTMDG